MRLALACLALLACHPAAADVVQIRSGQHPSFSRLVLSIPEGRSWELGRVDGGYGLLLGSGEDSFETSEIYDRITPNRIASITDAGGELRIELACDCHADAFLWQAGKLVLDIIDGPAPVGSEFEQALFEAPSEMSSENLAEMQEEAPEEPGSPAVLRAQLPILTETPGASIRPPLVPGTFATVPPSDNRVADAERAIIESLARAASQGVFEVASRPVPILPDSITEDGEEPPGRLPVLTPVTDPMDGMPTELDGPGGTGGPGLILRTGIERGEDGEATLENEASHCILDEFLVIDTWGDDREFSVQIADQRRLLTSEFDVYPDGAIEQLAKTYIFFGFGQEARQVLALDGKRSKDRLVLDALSRVVDDVPMRSAVLTDQIDCDGFVVLWSGLAAGSLEGTSEDGRNAAVMAFRLLPDQLRGYLGARLAQLFLDIGDATTADIVLSGAQRLETGDTIEADLTSAAVIETTEGAGPAIEALDEMATENTRMTPEGLVRLINLMLENDRTVDDGLINLASAMRFEEGASEFARELGLVEVRARTERAEFSAVREMLDDDDIPFTREDRLEHMSKLYFAMTEKQDTAEFLQTAFSELPNGLDANTENAIAARLIEVGFPERAMTLLETSTVQEAMAERRYLRGEAAAVMGDLDALNEALTGLNDDRAIAIRARALAASGDYESALAEGMLLTDSELDPVEAWRAGAWSLLEESGDDLLQDASRAILTEAVPLPSPPTLASRQDLLDEAAEMRQMTGDLLGRFDIGADAVQ